MALVLTLNAGSSSLKCSVHDVTPTRASERYAAELELNGTVESARAATQTAIECVRERGMAVDMAGHRFVFGGESDAPAIIDGALLRRLETLDSLDPLHAPQSRAVAEVAMRRYDRIPHVACFDTAYFRELPAQARMLPIPCKDPLLRRYGFHGFSYESAAAHLGDALNGRAVIAHLGSGSSLAALSDGRPVDTSMGFSPLGGVLMSSRPGDLDPGVILYLIERSGMQAPALRTMLESASGLRALAGEGDMRALSERARAGDASAAFAIECYVRSIAKAAGALTAVLGGLDAFAFTGGVGEHQPEVRSGVAFALEHLGLTLNRERNAASEPIISEPDSKVPVYVVASDENAAIARHAYRCAALEANTEM